MPLWNARIRILHFVTIAYAALILLITLKSMSGTQLGARNAWHWCMRCGDLATVDVLLNMALFVPLGLGLALLRLRAWWSLAILSLGPMMIEIAQIWIPGRDPSARDVLSNALGGLIGLWVARNLRRWEHISPAGARRLMWTTAASVTLVWAIAGWLLHPVSPPTPFWWSLWAHHLPYTAPFEGKLLASSFQGRPIPDGPILPASGIPDSYESGPIELRAVIVAGPRSSGPAPIIIVTDGIGHPVAQLDRDGEDLLFRTWLRASAAGLQSPGIRLDGAFSAARAEDTVVVRGLLHDGRLETIFKARGGSKVAYQDVSPTSAWSLLVPIEHAFGPEGRIFDALWIMIVFFPIALLAGTLFGVDRTLALATAVTTGITCLSVIPALSHLHQAAPREWVSWLFSTTAGMICGWRWMGFRPERN